jgi:SNF2 family DNA or RNA helicase
MDEKCRWSPQFEMTDPSAKLDTLMELLEDRENDQIVVFSHFKSTIKLLAERLEKRNIAYGLLTGDVDAATRTQNVQDFQAGRTRIFAGTIAAGGVGITLTASSTVVFIDRAWSPSINSQAEDRTHRIGQAEAVEIIDLMARNTVDLGKAQQLVTKMKWLRMLLGDKVDTDTVINNIDITKAIEVRDEGE